MEKVIAKLCTVALLVGLSGCSKKPDPLPFIIQSEGVLIESNDRASSAEISKILQLTTTEPVLYDELDCIKGPTHIRVKKEGSLHGAFDVLVDAGWDCVLILD
ncbi:MAG: hypothetical protein P8X74_08465 [Reinekea sp.]